MVRAAAAAREVFVLLRDDVLRVAWDEVDAGLLALVRYQQGRRATPQPTRWERAAAAAQAVQQVDEWALRVPAGMVAEAVWALARAARGVLVFRLADQCGSDDRDAFLGAAEEAFGGGPLDLLLHSQLLLAYRTHIWGGGSG